MSQILIYSDIHVHNHKGSQDRLEDCLKVLEWVFDTARERGIQNVVFAGDLFQDRQKIQVLNYHRTFKVFEKYSDLQHWLLLGNHDLWYYDKTDISSVEPLGAMPHVHVLSEPCTKTIAGLDIDFLPYTTNPVSAILEHFQQKSPVLVAHLAVDGAILHFHHRTKAEVSVELDNEMVVVGRDIFDGWKRVFLGHYHGAQKLTDKVEYVGSPLQLSFGETEQRKHIIVLDTDTLEREYIVNKFSPRHYVLTPDEMEGLELDGHFVRIHIDDLYKTDVIEMRRKLAAENPNAQFTIQHEKAKDGNQEEQLKKFDLASGDTLERYIEAVGYGELDRKRLLELGKEICLAN